VSSPLWNSGIKEVDDDDEGDDILCGINSGTCRVVVMVVVVGGGLVVPILETEGTTKASTPTTTLQPCPIPIHETMVQHTNAAITTP
jgi:hypothetical protein